MKFVLDESGSGGARCYRQVKCRRKFKGVIRFVVNVMSLHLEYATVVR